MIILPTIREGFNVWEYWVRNANWFFYRELYENYEPVFANEYELFWEKKKSSTEQVEYTDVSMQKNQVKIEPINKASYKIMVEAPGVKYGIADMDLSYQVVKNPCTRSLITFSTMLRVTNTSAYQLTQEYLDAQYYLASKAEHTNIGITIVDGKGEVTITSMPDKNTSIEDLQVELGKVYAQDCLDVVVVDSVRTDEAGFAYLTIADNALSQKLIQGATELRFEDKWIPAEFSVMGDGKSIVAKVNVNAIGEELTKYISTHNVIHIR